MNSLVSIIIPCYIQAQYLDETLQSVLAQTYDKWECIIVNDGSPDITDEVAKVWLDRDNRFKYIYKENGGLSSARNAGLRVAMGDFIQFLDADDYLDSRKLEFSLKAVQFDIENNIIISNFRMFVNDPAQSSIPYCKLSADLFNFDKLLYDWENGFTIPIHCGFFAVSLFLHFRFPEELKAKEDWILWILIYKNNCKTIFIDRPLALYRKNPNSMTQSVDMLDDFIRAYQYLKPYLSAEEYQKLTIVLLTRYYKSAGYFKGRLNQVKVTNTYRLGFLLKKIVLKLRILKTCKYFFEKLIK
ncbi:hypothetical protein SAMN05444396_104145 [Flavobacterium segetis]|uniref:Glycosyltransferase 2-like domain-containing protein n=1 Tax=Flavobacterium segetis TaxID=271157 RepID=A0A1M5GTJ6_9FLAO|nr:glycosyltransferase family 2 protein [Flavobacterium segetis]SHG06998.1 hypothetical protein SAMN05444396_104145 [Flavobacterium segetis]